MAVKIRLARMGAKKKPYYRVVVADIEAKRDGRFLEIIGTYDPNQNPASVKIKQDRLREWLAKGARPTSTVASLIKKVERTSASG
ncbi:MAG: 30S ribosomal protein S16 [Thermodesulfobacteriota bacterium]